MSDRLHPKYETTREWRREMLRPDFDKWGQSAEGMLSLSMKAEHPWPRERCLALYMIGIKQTNATQWSREMRFLLTRDFGNGYERKLHRIIVIKPCVLFLTLARTLSSALTDTPLLISGDSGLNSTSNPTRKN
jgi:hypothetical protein